jgi:hypothetical protein
MKWKGFGGSVSGVIEVAYHPSNCLEELRKNTKTLRIAGVPAVIRTEYLSNISLEGHL